MTESNYSRRAFLKLSALTTTAAAIGFAGCTSGTSSGVSAAGSGSAGFASSASSASSASATTVLKDSIYGDVEVTGEASKVVSTAPAYTVNILLLGAGEKIVGLDSNTSGNAWLKEKYPYLKSVSPVVASSELNVETLLNLSPDLVALAPSYKDAAYERLTSMGIPCISSPDVGDAGLLEQDKQLSLHFAKAIGGASVEKGEKFAQYFDDRVSTITAKTSKLSESERPKVLYVNALDPLTVSNGSNRSMPHAWIGPAGGTNCAAANTDDVKSGAIEVSMEQVLEWGPEIIICPNRSIADQLIVADAWTNVDAVVNGKVFCSPTGLMPWYANGPEMALMVDYAAKLIQPKLFADVDMRKTVETFYKDMFGIDVSESDLQRFFDISEPIDEYLAELFE